MTLFFNTFYFLSIIYLLKKCFEFTNPNRKFNLIIAIFFLQLVYLCIINTSHNLIFNQLSGVTSSPETPFYDFVEYLIMAGQENIFSKIAEGKLIVKNGGLRTGIHVMKILLNFGDEYKYIALKFVILYLILHYLFIIKISNLSENLHFVIWTLVIFSPISLYLISTANTDIFVLMGFFLVLIFNKNNFYLNYLYLLVPFFLKFYNILFVIFYTICGNLKKNNLIITFFILFIFFSYFFFFNLSSIRSAGEMYSYRLLDAWGLKTLAVNFYLDLNYFNYLNHHNLSSENIKKIINIYQINIIYISLIVLFILLTIFFIFKNSTKKISLQINNQLISFMAYYLSGGILYLYTINLSYKYYLIVLSIPFLLSNYKKNFLSKIILFLIIINLYILEPFGILFYGLDFIYSSKILNTIPFLNTEFLSKFLNLIIHSYFTSIIIIFGFNFFKKNA